MKVSIIIPVYNAEQYIGKCIESVLSQEFQDFELLLVDDGSTDRSSAICDSYSAKDKRVRCFHLKNGGPSKARNFGLRQARGEFIQFVDADDLITKDSGSIFNEAVKENLVDLVIANADIVDGNNNLLNKLTLGQQGVFETELLLEKMNHKEKEQFLHYIWNKWYCRRIIVEKGLRFNESIRLGEDFLFNCAYFTACKKISIVNKTVYRYYKRDDLSLTGKFNKDEIERRRIMDGSFIKMLRQRGVYEKNRLQYDAEIGEICLCSMESVTKSSCMLSIRGKKEFIEDFLNSEYYTYLMELRKSDKKQLWKQIALILIKQKCTYAILFFFWLKSKVKKNRIFKTLRMNNLIRFVVYKYGK